MISVTMTSHTRKTNESSALHEFVDFKGQSNFRRKVYQAVSCIPEGNVATYKCIADAIECKSAQVIGQALKNNPYAPFVPCHRVVSSSGGLGGYNGKSKADDPMLKLKKSMLKLEGVKFLEKGDGGTPVPNAIIGTADLLDLMETGESLKGSKRTKNNSGSAISVSKKLMIKPEVYEEYKEMHR